MDLDLKNKAFIVTGGTAGLGLATAQCLAAEGANVLISGRAEQKFHHAKQSFGELSDRIDFVAGDNGDADLPTRLLDRVLTRWGRLDGLLISVGGPPAGQALTTDDATWRRSFESIFLGTVRLLRDLSPSMADGGAIALVLAVSAREAAAELPISSGLRPGLALLAKNFADELGPRNIRVNTLMPNLFSTARVKQVLGETQPPVSKMSLRRIGDPQEFGRMATILLSPVASYVTGAAVAIDGGQLKFV